MEQYLKHRGTLDLEQNDGIVHSSWLNISWEERESNRREWRVAARLTLTHQSSETSHVRNITFYFQTYDSVSFEANLSRMVTEVRTRLLQF